MSVIMPVMWDEDTEGTSEVIGGNVITTIPEAEVGCVECGELRTHARGRCRIHYRRHLRDLNPPRLPPRRRFRPGWDR